MLSGHVQKQREPVLAMILVLYMWFREKTIHYLPTTNLARDMQADHDYPSVLILKTKQLCAVHPLGPCQSISTGWGHPFWLLLLCTLPGQTLLHCIHPRSGPYADGDAPLWPCQTTALPGGLCQKRLPRKTEAYQQVSLQSGLPALPIGPMSCAAFGLCEPQWCSRKPTERHDSKMRQC